MTEEEKRRKKRNTSTTWKRVTWQRRNWVKAKQTRLLCAASEDGESHQVDYHEDKLPCYHKVVWLLQTMVGNSILVVSFCYLVLEEQLNSIVLAIYFTFTAFMHGHRDSIQLRTNQVAALLFIHTFLRYHTSILLFILLFI